MIFGSAAIIIRQAYTVEVCKWCATAVRIALMSGD